MRGGGNALARRWIQKSGRYRADIERLLQSHNLPQDLLWLALIESAFNPEIHSHAGAAGLWQFMPATARIYGLTVNRSIDERLDPERSTIAALRHLSDLHKRFGTWELAFAAYNMGYGGLLSSLRKFNTNDYWELRRLEAGLPYETALYVPKIMAIAIIANNCDVFGCAGVQLDKARPFDKVAVGPGVTLKDIAEASGAKLEQIAGLNPQLIGSRTPPLQQAVAAPWRSEGHVVQARRSWTVYVPRGKGALTQEKLTPSAVPKRYGLHEVRWGESLARVAESYNTSSGYLTQINDLPASAAVRPGKVLFVPRREKSRADAPDEKTVAVVPAQTFSRSAQRRVFYDAVFGDRVQDVARVCGVEVDELVRWNHLDPAAKLQSGMRLQLFLPPTARPKNVRLVDADAYDVMSVESTPFFEHFVGLLDRKRLEITVAEGDTWRDYSKRFGLSLGMLERINHKSRRSKLEPGSKVVVYAKRALVPDSHATSASTSTARSVQNR